MNQPANPPCNDSDTALRGSAFHQSEAKDNPAALPGQLFYSTQIPVCLWFIRENGNTSAATFGLS